MCAVIIMGGVRGTVTDVRRLRITDDVDMSVPDLAVTLHVSTSERFQQPVNAILKRNEISGFWRLHWHSTFSVICDTHV